MKRTCQSKKYWMWILVFSLLFVLNNSANAATTGLLGPLKDKVKDAIEPIAFCGFVYSCSMLYARNIGAAIFGLVASILLFNADNILSSLK